MPRAVTPRGPLTPEETRLVALFEQAKRSVVYISTANRVIDPFTRNAFSVPRGTGSGFVWDDAGHVVTNHHVIEGANQARVRLADGRVLQADLVGTSPSHDLAVLRVDTGRRPPPPLPLGESSTLRVGQSVIAIGNPFGLDFTLTTGIISALDRSLPSEERGVVIQHLIQTDAAINPGNSGGPLLDSAGRLIGVNTAIYSPSGTSAGIGFAVPADTVNRVVPQLIANGHYLRPSLGFGYDEDLNTLITRELGVQGVAVLKVAKGSAAAKAGLRGAQLTRRGSIVPGDIVTAIDGKPIDTIAEMNAILDERRIGSRVKVRVWREGRTRDTAVVLEPGS
ncbi:MAG: trypsin-like peptidase domain-containing protein [Burkholderiaceae bacterium]